MEMCRKRMAGFETGKLAVPFVCREDHRFINCIIWFLSAVG